MEEMICNKCNVEFDLNDFVGNENKCPSCGSEDCDAVEEDDIYKDIED